MGTQIQGLEALREILFQHAFGPKFSARYLVNYCMVFPRNGQFSNRFLAIIFDCKKQATAQSKQAASFCRRKVDNNMIQQNIIRKILDRHLRFGGKDGWWSSHSSSLARVMKDDCFVVDDKDDLLDESKKNIEAGLEMSRVGPPQEIFALSTRFKFLTYKNFEHAYYVRYYSTVLPVTHPTCQYRFIVFSVDTNYKQGNHYIYRFKGASETDIHWRKVIKETLEAKTKSIWIAVKDRRKSNPLQED